MKTLVIVSGNAGKIREFQGLLQALPVSVQPQPEGLEVEETGTTFAANARLKAQAVAAATGEWALADDSGLSVDALDGAPGVHSARYAPTDPERIARLLKALNGSDQRQAYFCAALCVAAPDGTQEPQQYVLQAGGGGEASYPLGAGPRVSPNATARERRCQ